MDNPKEQREDKTWWQPGLILFGRLSGWIVGPVILALIVGQWIDKKYPVSPWGTLGVVGLAFIVSMVGIVKEGIAAMKKAEKELPKKGKNIKQ